MTPTMRLLAAAALLGVLSGCAGMMPNWKPNVEPDSMQNPPIYAPSPD
jgi:hypothetical protein